MTRTSNRLLALLAAFALSASTGLMVACIHDDGPAEEIGESLDDSAGEVSESVEEAGDELEDELG